MIFHSHLLIDRYIGSTVRGLEELRRFEDEGRVDVG
jgi:hypothetical protein